MAHPAVPGSRQIKVFCPGPTEPRSEDQHLLPLRMVYPAAPGSR